MEKGALIYRNDNNQINLFLFSKESSEILEKALPCSYNKNTMAHHDTLCVIFENGFDYLGSNTLDNVYKLIDEKKMIDLLNLSFDQINLRGFNDLKFNHYCNLLNFSKEQLKIE